MLEAGHLALVAPGRAGSGSILLRAWHCPSWWFARPVRCPCLACERQRQRDRQVAAQTAGLDRHLEHVIGRLVPLVRAQQRPVGRIAVQVRRQARGPALGRGHQCGVPWVGWAAAPCSSRIAWTWATGKGGGSAAATASASAMTRSRRHARACSATAARVLAFRRTRVLVTAVTLLTPAHASPSSCRCSYGARVVVKSMGYVLLA